MKTSTILAINVAVLVIYVFVISLMPEPTNDMPGLAKMIITMFLIGGHCGILFIASIILFFMKRTQLGKAFLLSTFVVLAIGTATCFGIGSFA